MSVRISVTDTGVSAAMQNAPRAIDGAAEQWVAGVTIDAEGGVIAATPVGATSHLRQSITHQISGSGIAIEGRVFSTDLPIKVVSVEGGRKPGKMPPRGPIELWVARKLGGDARVAFLVARAIGRRGTKGQFMFRKGAEVARASAAKRLPALRAAIARVI
jgi:hypothetical protein